MAPEILTLFSDLSQNVEAITKELDTIQIRVTGLLALKDRAILIAALSDIHDGFLRIDSESFRGLISTSWELRGLITED